MLPNVRSPILDPSRCVGVIGGVFVCMGYAVKITTHAVEAVTGTDKTSGLVAAESTSVGGFRKRFGSADLRLRAGAKDRVIRQGSGWVVEGGSPYGSYAGTPLSATFGSPQPTPGPYTPALPPSSTPRTASFGLGIASPRHSVLSPHTPGSHFPTAATAGSPYTPGSGSVPPGTPSMYSHFPPTPNPPHSAVPGAPGGSVFAAQQGGGPPRSGGVGSAGLLQSASNGSAHGGVSSAKKDD